MLQNLKSHFLLCLRQETIQFMNYELRCFFGGGLRVYYTMRRQQVVLLLAGGNKTTQAKDIEKAKVLLKALGE